MDTKRFSLVITLGKCLANIGIALSTVAVHAPQLARKGIFYGI